METIPQKEVDITEVHPGRLAARVRALWEEGALKEGTTVLLPHRNRIIVKSQTKGELYKEAVAIAADILGTNLVATRDTPGGWGQNHARALNLLRETMKTHKVEETLQRCGFEASGETFGCDEDGRIVCQKSYAYSRFPLVQLTIKACEEAETAYPQAELHLLHGHLSNEDGTCEGPGNFIEMRVGGIDPEKLADLNHLAELLAAIHTANGETLSVNGYKPTPTAKPRPQSESPE